MKNTMIERYGTEHALNVTEFKEKMKETNMKKFGFEYASTNDDIKNKIKNTCLERYGVTTTLLDKNTQDKISKTNLEKYGAKNVFELKKFRVDNLYEKYGVEHATQLDIFQNKLEMTNLERYGFINAMSNDDVKKEDAKTKPTQDQVDFQKLKDAMKKWFDFAIYKKMNEELRKEKGAAKAGGTLEDKIKNIKTTEHPDSVTAIADALTKADKQKLMQVRDLLGLDVKTAPL